MTKKKITILFGGLLLGIATFAQDQTTFEEQTKQRLSILEDKSSANKLQLSGYIQFDTKYTQNSDNILNSEGFIDWDKTKNLDTWVDDIRRARLKGVYSAPYGKATLEFNISPFSIGSSKVSGVSLKNAFIQTYIPSYEFISLTTGVFERPFGYELSYSSSTMETAERSIACQALLPGEQDLGAKLTLTGKSGFLTRFTLDAGLFTGNGLSSDGPTNVHSNKKHFIGRLAYKQHFDKFSLSGGISYYNGDYFVKGDLGTGKGTLAFWDNDAKKYLQTINGSDTVFSTKRKYFGADVQAFAHTEIGSTSFRAELYTGQQPTTGGWGNWRSNSDGTVNNNGDNKVYNFTGFYVLLVQDIWTTKHSLVFRYDMFDPNTKVKGDEIKSKDDLNKSVLSIGYLYRASVNLRILIDYDIVSNETSKEIKGWKKNDRRDNILTLRLQYKF